MIERFLVVLNADQTIKGISVTDETGIPIDATSDQIESIIKGAGSAVIIQSAQKKIEALTELLAERDVQIALLKKPTTTIPSV